MAAISFGSPASTLSAAADIDYYPGSPDKQSFAPSQVFLMDLYREQLNALKRAASSGELFLGPGNEVEFDRRYPAPVSVEFLRRLGDIGIRPEWALPSELDWNDYLRLNEFLLGLGPSDRQRAGVDNVQPPIGSGLHGHLKQFLHDLHSCDLLVHALSARGLELDPNGKYLDFGCSTGRTISTLACYLGSPNLMACDPVKSSVDWAAENHRSVHFFESPIWPRLPLEDNSLDGVYSNSVWTHFSEKAADAWLQEMHRIIRPGGFFCFTTKGLMSIAIALNNPKVFKNMLAPALENENFLAALIAALSDSGFFFTTERYLDKTASDDWGQTFISHRWIDEHCSNTGFAARTSLLMAWGFKQDLHVVTKT